MGEVDLDRLHDMHEYLVVHIDGVFGNGEETSLSPVELVPEIVEVEDAGEVEGVDFGVLLVEDRLELVELGRICLLYTSPSPRDLSTSRMPSSA